LAPPAGSQPLTRWARGLCGHPEDRVPPHTSYKLRQGVGRASTRYHERYSFGPHLPTEVSSGAATCPSALDLTSLSRWASALPRVPWLRALPPRDVSSGAATHSSALDLASLSRWALALPRVPWLRALPPRDVSSGAAMCSSALDLASLPRWAPALPRGPGLATPRGELRCCHVPHGPQQAVNHRNKKGPSCPRHVAGLTCIQSMVACYQGACKACGHTATVRFNRATQTQLTTPGHGYSGDMTRQDGTTALTMFSIAG
jgi:hypothetical protein